MKRKNSHKRSKNLSLLEIPQMNSDRSISKLMEEDPVNQIVTVNGYLETEDKFEYQNMITNESKKLLLLNPKKSSNNFKTSSFMRKELSIDEELSSKHSQNGIVK